MQELLDRSDRLLTEVNEAMARLHIDELEQELATLRTQTQAPDFWNDNLHAQEVMKQVSRLEGRVKPWRDLETA
ncbi:MAG TPA: hypothetical protein VFK03_03475, partial [Candidatus Saccharimonadales bacterium]|nr:hypothetical protein [Candidatus Saccharimonadales bacterium]